MSSMSKRRLASAVAVVAATMGLATAAQAATISWNVDSGNWNTNTSWNPSDANPSGDDISITRAGTTTSNMNIAGLSVNSMAVNQTTAGNSHTLDLSSNTLTVAGNYRVGYINSAITTRASLLVSNGGLVIGSSSAPGRLQVGYRDTLGSSTNSGNGTFEQTSGTFAANLIELGVGYSVGNANTTTATGTLDLHAINNGSLSVQTVGMANGGYQTSTSGTVSLGTGWTLQVGSDTANGDLVIGTKTGIYGTATGSLTAASATFTGYLNNFHIGVTPSNLNNSATATGTFSLGGGSVNASATSFRVGDGRATGTVTLPSGQLSVSTAVQIGDVNTGYLVGGTGTVNLNNTKLAVASTGTMTIGVSGEINANISAIDKGIQIDNLSSTALTIAKTSATSADRGLYFVFDDPANTTLGTALSHTNILYGLKWSGDHVNDINTLISANKIGWDSTATPSVSLQVIGGQMPKAGIFARKHGVAGLLHGRR